LCLFVRCSKENLQHKRARRRLVDLLHFQGNWKIRELQL
jgi:hypothetical protein